MGLHNDKKIGIPDELSDTWCELLGIDATDMQIHAEMGVLPIADDDPWHKLLHAQGAEMIDLQHVRLSDIRVALSEQEVEQALQMIEEQPSSVKDQG